MNYGRALKVARAMAGLQQRDVARLAGLDPSYISLIEVGRRKPSLDSVEKLSQALDIPTHLFTLLAAESKDLNITDQGELRRTVESLAHLLFNDGHRTRKRIARRRTPPRA